ncbi:MAG: PAS domain S-box protein, partial [Acidobacteriota bacterium]|nr:PAS domain S-box protein [Acidobacteriota bacterium]
MLFEALDVLATPMLVLDPKLRLDFANQGYITIFSSDPDPLAADRFAGLLAQLIRGSNAEEPFEITHEFAALGRRTLRLDVKRLERTDRLLLVLNGLNADTRTGPSADGLAQIMAANVGGVILAEENGRITAANPAFLEMVGCSQRDVRIGLSWTELTPVAWRLADVRALTQVRNEGRCLPYEKEYIRSDGSRLPVLQSLAILPDSAETLIAFISDLSEYKKAEHDRMHLLKQQAAVLNAAGEGIVGLDVHGSCNLINPLACTMLGYTAEECLGRNMHELSHYKHADGTPYPREECPAYHALLLGKGSSSEEDLIWRKDGSRLAVSLTTQPVLVNGEVAGAVITMRDISALQAARLESSQRTLELARSNSELQQFAYVAAHDLKEPLHTVAGFTELLNERYSDQWEREGREFLALIAESTESMTRMIGNLLAYAQLNANPLALRLVDSEDALRRTLETLAASIREAGATVLHGPLPAIYADEIQLLQVLQNLISNGIKFGADRPIVVEVNAVVQEAEWFFMSRIMASGLRLKILDRYLRYSTAAYERAPLVRAWVLRFAARLSSGMVDESGWSRRSGPVLRFTSRFRRLHQGRALRD